MANKLKYFNYQTTHDGDFFCHIPLLLLYQFLSGSTSPNGPSQMFQAQFILRIY